MDIFTHAVLPLAAFALLLRRPLAERLAAGLGAAMPDMDAFASWMTRLDDSLYSFTHRGWSHSLWGAPLLAVAGLIVLTRPWWARRWPRMAAFQLNPLTVAAVLVGGWSHLVLDGLTISGVPLLWPFSLDRVTLNLFFYAVVYMTPVGAWIIWRLYRGTLDDRALRRGTLVLVAMLVVSGGVRAATMPRDIAPDALVQPAPLEVQWYVATPTLQGWRVEQRAPWDVPPALLAEGNTTPDAAEAVAQARALGAYIAWHWQNPAPVVNATPIDGGWRVEFRDAVAMARNMTGGFLAGMSRPADALVVEVVDGRATAVKRPGFWGFG